MAQPVDPNAVLMTGENSFIRLSLDGGQTLSTRVSHWRVLWCPAGAGHAMFIQSPLIDNRVQIYSDNMAVARWLQRTIETLLYPAFADVSLPVIGAQFARAGDPSRVPSARLYFRGFTQVSDQARQALEDWRSPRVSGHGRPVAA